MDKSGYLCVRSIQDDPDAEGRYVERAYFKNATHLLGVLIKQGEQTVGFIKVINKVLINEKGNYINEKGIEIKKEHEPVLDAPFNDKEDKEVLNLMAIIISDKICLLER